METTIVYRVYIEIMENEMQTAIVYWRNAGDMLLHTTPLATAAKAKMAMFNLGPYEPSQYLNS